MSISGFTISNFTIFGKRFIKNKIYFRINSIFTRKYLIYLIYSCSNPGKGRTNFARTLKRRTAASPAVTGSIFLFWFKGREAVEGRCGQNTQRGVHRLETQVIKHFKLLL